MKDIGMLTQICAACHVEPPRDPGQLNPLVLAYIGDSIFDLAVRTKLACSHDAKAHMLHHMSSRQVCAAAQARTLDAILSHLSAEELAIVQRGRNAKPGTIPKNASPKDYAAATGLEALLGWLFLGGREERLGKILEYCIAAQGPDEAMKAAPFRP